MLGDQVPALVLPHALQGHRLPQADFKNQVTARFNQAPGFRKDPLEKFETCVPAENRGAWFMQQNRGIHAFRILPSYIRRIGNNEVEPDVAGKAAAQIGNDKVYTGQALEQHPGIGRGCPGSQRVNIGGGNPKSWVFC